LLQMEEHSKADENFYITAATVLDLASRALEILKSSEVTEKRALLNFLLQNCVLNGRKLLFELNAPFDVIAQYGKTQNWLPGLDDVDNK
jgi:site-specific DNA recombinase